jgi:hypothetical protein
MEHLAGRAHDVFGPLRLLSAQVFDGVQVGRQQRLKRVAELVGDLDRVAPLGGEQARE